MPSAAHAARSRQRSAADARRRTIFDCRAPVFSVDRRAHARLRPRTGRDAAPSHWRGAKTFAERGVSGFGRVERVLRRALEKCPEARFASVREFRDALQQALDHDCNAQSGLRRHGHATHRSALLDELIERATLGGELMIGGVESPSASVNFGSAGLAYAMLRMAQQRQDGSLLAVADVWSEAALRDVQAAAATAFTAPDLEISSGARGTCVALPLHPRRARRGCALVAASVARYVARISET